MTVKTLTRASDGATFKLGRKRPRARAMHLKMMHFTRPAMLHPPAALDYTAKAGAELAAPLLNDQLGCCTASAAFHIVGAMLGNADAPVAWTDEQVRLFYERFGYRPDDPSTDRGANEVDVLNSWHTHGLLADGSHKIGGYVAVNADDPAELRAALWLFENVYFGVELPDEWINPFPARDGFMWGATAGAPDPENGHAFPGLGYNAEGVIIDTWGLTGVITWSAIAKYCGRAGNGVVWAVLSTDSLKRGVQKSPEGFNWTQMIAGMNLIGNGGRLAA